MFKVAAIQLDSQNNKEENLKVTGELIREAHSDGASMISLPEYFNFIGESEEEKAIAKRAQMTLMDHLQEYEERKEETKPKEQATFDFATNNASAHANEDPKMKNLLQNEEVMNMLKNISKGSNGKIPVSF